MIFKSNLVIIIGKIGRDIYIYVCVCVCVYKILIWMYILRYHSILLIMISRLDFNLIIIIFNI